MSNKKEKIITVTRQKKGKTNSNGQPATVIKKMAHAVAQAINIESNPVQGKMKSIAEALSIPSTVSKTPSVFKEVPRMARDTLKFARTYGDPFRHEETRLPVSPSYPSEVIRCFQSGTSITNADGVGFITLAPAGGIFNSGYCGGYSGALSGDAFEDPLATGMTPYQLDSTFTQDDFDVSSGPTRAYRIVSAGIRVRSLASVFNAAGIARTIQMLPTIGDLSSISFAEVTNYDYKEYSFRDSKWHSLTRHAIDPLDDSYLSFSSAIGTSVYTNLSTTYDIKTPDDNQNMGIIFRCEASTPWEWEVSIHYEYIGTSLRRQNYVQPDAQGVGVVRSAYSQKRFQDTTTKDHTVDSKTGFLDVVKNGFKTVLPMLPEIIGMFL
jgi:hypothetical protein